MKVSVNAPCPCGSGAKLKRCCGAYHRGRPAPTPEALMRSRYAAYALGLVDYILATTDPTGPQVRAPRDEWAREVLAFCAGTVFEGLEIVDTYAEDSRGWVTFRARLRQGGADASFGEQSLFHRRDGRWLYHSGEPRPTTVG